MILNRRSFSSLFRLANNKIEFPCLDKLEEKKQHLLKRKLPNNRTIDVNFCDLIDDSYVSKPKGFKTFTIPSYQCDYGGKIKDVKIAYETWGTLNSSGTNAILLLTGLSVSSHAKSSESNPEPGWWESFMGPNEALDTNKYFIICANYLGGCFGSTGPSSIDSEYNAPYATRFPLITIHDISRVLLMLTDHLNVKEMIGIGSSMGGLSVLAAVLEAPKKFKSFISIAGAARTHPYTIGLRHVQRQAIMSDPNFNRGFYYDGLPPYSGMKLARQIATLSFRSPQDFEFKFGNERMDTRKMPAFCPDFLIESYLDYQGEKWCLNYDPNSFIYLSKAMDIFDLRKSKLDQLENIKISKPKFTPLSELDPHRKTQFVRKYDHEKEFRDLVKGLESIEVPNLIIGIESDNLIPYQNQLEIHEALIENGNDSTYVQLDPEAAPCGHDSFLIKTPDDHIGNNIKFFLSSQ